MDYGSYSKACVPMQEQYLEKRKKEKKNKNPRMFYFSILKNVNVVLTEKVVIKMVQKRKHTQKL